VGKTELSMVKRTGPTNPYLRSLISTLKEKSLELKAPIWRAVAEKLEKPRRKKVEVNLLKIERNTNVNDVVVVPGVILANGELSKPVTIAAWKFSSSAQEKIKKSGGRILTIEKLIEENPKGSKVKIIS
jgi:large subunit ribosomal protein L18e